MHSRQRLAAAVSLLSMGISFTQAHADYFFDQGFINPVVRTDYNATNEGTSANPLTLTSCLYPASSSIDPLVIDGTCNSSPSTFPRSNFFSMNGGATASRFWLLLMNNEYWNLSLNGPPDQSLPRALPGQGVMGFNVLTGSLPGETFNRAHLVLNNTFASYSDHQWGPNNIPFLAISADSRRGNGSTIGAMNSTLRPHVVSFISRLWDFLPGDASGAYNHYLWTTANWGGRNRMLFINLYWKNINWSAPGRPGLHRHWSWPIQESVLYPGGDIAFFDINALAQSCPQAVWGDNLPLQAAGDQRYYAFDLTAAFRCASNLGYFDSPMPTTVVPLYQAGWSNEATGAGVALWTSVHDMTMEAPGALNAVMRSPQASQVVNAQAPGESTAEIRRALIDSCTRDPVCQRLNRHWLETDTRPVLDPNVHSKFTSLREVSQASSRPGAE